MKMWTLLMFRYLRLRARRQEIQYSRQRSLPLLLPPGPASRAPRHKLLEMNLIKLIIIKQRFLIYLLSEKCSNAIKKFQYYEIAKLSYLSC